MITIIAAVAKNNVIGAKNDLPWYLPEDLKHFKEITSGHTVIMGRKTYESIVSRLGKPLPNRKNIVITRNNLYQVPEGVEKADSLQSALQKHSKDTFIIGGASIFEEGLMLADQLIITHVHKEYPGDTYFPEIDPHVWEEIGREDHGEYSFVTYKRHAS